MFNSMAVKPQKTNEYNNFLAKCYFLHFFVINDKKNKCFYEHFKIVKMELT